MNTVKLFIVLGWIFFCVGVMLALEYVFKKEWASAASAFGVSLMCAALAIMCDALRKEFRKAESDKKMAETILMPKENLEQKGEELNSNK